MSNFKVGDIVVCVNNTRYPAQIRVGVPKTVHSVSLCGKYLRVHRDDRLEIGGYDVEDFELYTEQDDPLPPAPESVSYYNSYITRRGNDQHLVLIKDNKGYPDENLMYLGIVPRTGSMRTNKEIGINLDVDAALQLAHDLRRMAMENKRKEKQA